MAEEETQNNFVENNPKFTFAKSTAPKVMPLFNLRVLRVPEFMSYKILDASGRQTRLQIFCNM